MSPHVALKTTAGVISKVNEKTNLRASWLQQIFHPYNIKLIEVDFIPSILCHF